MHLDWAGPLESVLDQFFLGVLIIDGEGRIIYYNKRMSEMDEMGAQDALGYKISEVYSVREADSPTMIALRTGRPVDGQFMPYKTARGRQLNTLNHAYPIFRQGEAIGAICLVTDVTSLAATILPAAKPMRQSAEKAVSPRLSFEDLIGINPLFREAIDVAKVAAQGPSPVMLVGETGTGKDLFAKAIHDYGARAEGRFMAINCSAIPEALLEGILFGTTKGAFTGATDKEGLLEYASGGTLFLDEINSMPLSLQAKLLRVLQDHRVRRVGGLADKRVDLRIISASNINPLKAIETRTLRADLYYRLGVVQVRIPPLRERPEDIPHLANHFLNQLNNRFDKKVAGLSTGVLQVLKRRSWPGNVRELEHAIESAMNFVCDGETLSERHLRRVSRHIEPVGASPGAKPERLAAPDAIDDFTPLSEQDERGTNRVAAYSPARSIQPLNLVPARLKGELDQTERIRLSDALRRSGGNISRAAASLGLSPQLMSYKMKKHHLKKDG